MSFTTNGEKNSITITTILLFFTVTFFWYSQLTEATFNLGIKFMKTVAISLSELFILESRNSTIQNLAGVGLKYGFISGIAVLLTWSTFLFIGVGVIYMLTIFSNNKKSKKIVNIFHNPNLLRIKLDLNFMILSFVCCTFLLSMIFLPYLSKGYNMQRLYLQMLVILSTSFSFGGILLSTGLSHLLEKMNNQTDEHGKNNKKNNKPIISNLINYLREKPFLLILVILLPYFLYNVGLLYQLIGIPYSIILNSNGDVYNEGAIIKDQDISSSVWSKDYVDPNKTIFTNSYGLEVLLGEGLISPSKISSYLFPVYEASGTFKGYAYLRYLTIPNRKITIYYPDGRVEKHSLEDYPDLLKSKLKIYSNGDSEVYSS